MISRLVFKKFRPSQEISRGVDEMLLQIYDYLPQGATAAAYMTKVRNRYQCMLKVSCQSGSLIEDCLSPDPLAALSKVAEKMKSQLINLQLTLMTVDEPTFWNFKEVVSR